MYHFGFTSNTEMVENEPSSIDYSCDICQHVFKGPWAKYSLQSHKEIHKDVRITFKCEECQKSFSRSRYLKKHKLLHFGIQKDKNRTKDFKCKVCSKEFHYKGNLKEHMKIHELNKPTCEQCGKPFSTPYTLIRHMKTHNAVREKFQCNVCQKDFLLKQGLKDHMMIIHQQNAKVQCNLCTKEYTTKKILKIHIRSAHTAGGIPRYACKICKKVFQSKDNFEKHKCEVKSFKCELCNREFNCHSSLNSHNLIHDKNREKYQCPKCEQEFVIKSYLQEHIKKVHED